jgi:hypothetical protein
MTARLALAALLAVAAGGACRRRAPALKMLPEPAAGFERSVRADSPDAKQTHAAQAADAASPPTRPAAGADSAAEPLLTAQKLSPALRKLVDAAHAHRAVASLEAAGCDQALVMTGADYNRFVDLRHETKMPTQVDDPRADVVWCQRRTPTPPSCAELAPIFARVARPKRPFMVFSGYQPAPFAPRCAGKHDTVGRYLGGEGPGYASSR